MRFVRAQSLTKILESHLKHIGSSCRGEVDRFEQMLFWIVFITVALHHDRLRRTLFTNQQHSL